MRPQERKPVNWRVWILGAAVVLVLVVILQNSQQVSVEVLFASFEAPLIVVLLVAVGVGAGLGWAALILLRHPPRAAPPGPRDRSLREIE